MSTVETTGSTSSSSSGGVVSTPVYVKTTNKPKHFDTHGDENESYYSVQIVEKTSAKKYNS